MLYKSYKKQSAIKLNVLNPISKYTSGTSMITGQGNRPENLEINT